MFAKNITVNRCTRSLRPRGLPSGWFRLALVAVLIVVQIVHVAAMHKTKMATSSGMAIAVKIKHLEGKAQKLDTKIKQAAKDKNTPEVNRLWNQKATINSELQELRREYNAGAGSSLKPKGSRNINRTTKRVTTRHQDYGAVIKTSKCPKCNGEGKVPGMFYGTKKCGKCNGSGTIKESRRRLTASELLEARFRRQLLL